MGICSRIKAKSAPLPDTTDEEQGTSQEPIETKPDPIKPAKWDHIDSTHIVPSEPLKLSLNFLDLNSESLPNKKFLTIIDFSKHSGRKRLYLVDLNKGSVESHCVAHGKNSDPDNDGYATLFSNVNGSQQSTLGFARTGSTYDGKYPYSLKLHGLSRSNSNMYSRYIVMHPSDYVNDGSSKQGRSWGCPAVQKSISRGIVDKIKGGSLMLLWHPKFREASL